MAIVQYRSRRKVSGGRYIDFRKKKLRDAGRLPTLTKIGKRKISAIRSTGGKVKNSILNAEVANVFDPKTKKYTTAKIELVVANPANRHYVRRNIITKGTIIKTDKGEARVTSRPGQEGSINAVLIGK